METQRWHEIRTLFEAACDLSPAQRAEFLDRSCRGDGDLKTEVESIIAQSDIAPAFLEGPAADSFPDLLRPSADAELVGRRLGAYELQGVIASGGMGTVYLASRADGAFDRRVAIKVVRHRGLTEDALRRFRDERRTLAALEHPNIASLLDAGVTDDGMPYLVMEHVDGAPVDRYCDDHRLSTRARLELFLQIGAAVQHAHGHLIVHRDLKPGNILVTAEGLPKLLDFGIARMLEPLPGGPAPDTALRVMTPEYASPEQIRGEPVTTATDVYSLGVVLFELLTGHRPHRLKSRVPHEIERAVCQEDPERPSTAIGRIEERTAADGTTCVITPEVVSRTRDGQPHKLRRRLAGDLDAIALMALRRESRHRYASVEQLCDDIRRHLRGLPVMAREGTWRYRAGKSLRAHRGPVLAAAAIILALGAGLIAATVQGRRAIEARALLEQETARVHLVNDFLKGMIASVDPGGAQWPRESVREILDDAARQIDGGLLAGQSDVEAELRTTIGMAYLELGLVDTAEPHLVAALDIRQNRFGKRHPDVADSLNALGRLARARGDHDRAEARYREALELRRSLLGEASAPGAQTMNDLGVLLRTRGRLDEAEDLLAGALRVRRDLVADLERDPSASPTALRAGREDLATSMTNLAAALKNQGEYEQAETLDRSALQLFETTLGPHHHRVAVVLNNLALLLMDTGCVQEAEALYRRALAIRRRVFGDEHQAVATGLKNLALLLARRGQYEEAERLYREALAIDRRPGGDEDRLANTLSNLADLLVTVGRADEAETLCREALEIRQRYGPDHPRMATSYLLLGRIMLARGDAASAETWLRKALPIYRAQAPANQSKAARAQSELGGALWALGRFEEAETHLLESLRAVEKAPAPEEPLLRQTLERIVALYDAWERPGEAARYRARLAGPAAPPGDGER